MESCGLERYREGIKETISSWPSRLEIPLNRDPYLSSLHGPANHFLWPLGTLADQPLDHVTLM